MGINGTSTTSVIFKDCQVPVENVLFEVGKEHKIAFNILNIGGYKLGVGVTGGCKYIIAEATKYANSREQFGEKISSFGMIKNKLADMVGLSRAHMTRIIKECRTVGSRWHRAITRRGIVIHKGHNGNVKAVAESYKAPSLDG